jgi:hypothetical protein
MPSPIHPICRLFPMFPKAELEGMAEDIRRRGKLLEPIVLLNGAPRKKGSAKMRYLAAGGFET